VSPVLSLSRHLNLHGHVVTHIKVKARNSTNQQQIKTDEQIADEDDAAHKVDDEAGAFVRAAVILLTVVQLIAVDEPEYEQSVDNDEAGDLVGVLVLVEVSNNEDLQQLK
jgi:hypothetical protein